MLGANIWPQEHRRVAPLSLGGGGGGGWGLLPQYFLERLPEN